jgi:two-component system, NarL family, response regulator
VSRYPHLAGRALSERELDVLERVEQGWTNERIAADLRIALPTVKRHVDRGLSKLGARNRAHAVALAYRTGLFVISTPRRERDRRRQLERAA